MVVTCLVYQGIISKFEPQRRLNILLHVMAVMNVLLMQDSRMVILSTFNSLSQTAWGLQSKIQTQKHIHLGRIHQTLCWSIED